MNEERRWRAELACGFSTVEGYGEPPSLGSMFICEKDTEPTRKEPVVRVWWTLPTKPKRKKKHRRD